MNKAAVEKALGEAKALVASLEEYKEHQECHAKSAYHLSLLELVDKCHTALEEPYDLATRWLENMSEVAALYVLLRIDAFEKLPAQGSIAAADLASECKVDASVITRAMRILVAKGIFKETDKDEYAHNLLSQAFRPDALGGFACVSVGIMNAWIAVPEYAKFHKPEELYDIKKSPFAFVAGHEGKTYYEVLDMDPKERALWNMTLQNMAKNFPVLGMFPFRDLEGRVKKELERPFIVDIGGGRGQALLKIREDCGGAFGGKLILQDLPVVIDTLKWEEIPGIAPMAYDIFTEQPVKNAHVYFMRRLLHDFYDPVVIKILKNTVSAMAPDSRLIVCDMLVPDRVKAGGPMTLYWLDFSLLAIGGKERSLGEFENIFSEVGLELVKVYESQGSNIAMLETRLMRSGDTARP